MRKTKLSAILTTYFLFTVALTLSVFVCHKVFCLLPKNEFRAIITVIIGVPVYYLFTLLIYRIFIALFALKAGDVPVNSRQEFIQNVHVLFYTEVFNFVIMNTVLPVYYLRFFYKMLGVQLGENSYCSGTIFDGQFVTIGKNSLLGMGCILSPHLMEGNRLAYYPISIGHNVTIGARAVIYGGAKIGNQAIVASGAIVLKNTVIGENEIWGGVPARFIKKRAEEQHDSNL